MKAVVVTHRGCGSGRDAAGGAARAAGSDKRRRASGFVLTEMAWADRADRGRTPPIPAHVLAGVVTAFVRCWQCEASDTMLLTHLRQNQAHQAPHPEVRTFTHSDFSATMVFEGSSDGLIRAKSS